jgi:lysophospholipase L1-like esterase
MLALTLAVFVFAEAQSPWAQGGRNTERWVGTWATALVTTRPQAPQGPPPNPTPQPGAPAAGAQPPQGRGGPGLPPPPQFNSQTLRQIVHTSIGGDRIRVIFSNAFGTAPLAVGAASVALREKEAAIVPGSSRMLTFAESPSTTIPPGAVIYSDPVTLKVPPQADLAIDLYLPGDTSATPSPMAVHLGALQTSYVSPMGNHAGVADLPVMTTVQTWFFVARVEVMSRERTSTIVAFGDSITDGTRSTINTNKRWPDYLARRLMARRHDERWSVLNAGIAGNRVLSDGAGVNALARLDRDVLLQTGVTHVIVLEGINDIGFARNNPVPSVAELIAGHRQIIARAHARGLRIYGGTLTPFEGAAYWTPEGEAKRQALNEWIRSGRAYDGVIDFDAAVRDPQQPTKFVPMYQSGDHLHPSDAGYEAMANAIDLGLFRTGR